MSVERAGKGERRWHSMKRGSVRDGFEIFENGIEPLDVADLQDAILLLRELHQFRGLRGVVGHRFLDEDVFALREQLFRESKWVVVGVTMLRASLAAAASARELKIARVVFGGNFARGVGVRCRKCR